MVVYTGAVSGLLITERHTCIPYGTLRKDLMVNGTWDILKGISEHHTEKKIVIPYNNYSPS